MIRLSILSGVLTALLLAPLFAGAADGADTVMSDPLLEHMAGEWKMTGTLVGKPATHSVSATWILNHQFLEIHELGATDPKTGRPDYEAMPVIGYDNTSERYVAHWLDIFGGRFSETLGYGTRRGNEIDFIFEYPDGPFHTTFVWDPTKSTWRWHMTRKDAQGKWTEFANLTLRHQ